jgi:LPXTG-motif cell wall-anchored protein
MAELPDVAGSADDGSSTFLIVVAGVGAGVALTGGAYYARRRKRGY